MILVLLNRDHRRAADESAPMICLHADTVRHRRKGRIPSKESLNITLTPAS